MVSGEFEGVLDCFLDFCSLELLGEISGFFLLEALGLRECSPLGIVPLEGVCWNPGCWLRAFTMLHPVSDPTSPFGPVTSTVHSSFIPTPLLLFALTQHLVYR